MITSTSIKHHIFETDRQWEFYCVRIGVLKQSHTNPLPKWICTTLQTLPGHHWLPANSESARCASFIEQSNCNDSTALLCINIFTIGCVLNRQLLTQVITVAMILCKYSRWLHIANTSWSIFILKCVLPKTYMFTKSRKRYVAVRSIRVQ